MFEKTTQNEQKRFRGLDLVLELDCFGKNFCWPNESQKTGRLPVGLLPQFDRDWAEPRPELIGLECGELAKSVHAPFVKNGDDLRNLFSGVALPVWIFRPALFAQPNITGGSKYVQENIFLGIYWNRLNLILRERESTEYFRSPGQREDDIRESRMSSEESGCSLAWRRNLLCLSFSAVWIVVIRREDSLRSRALKAIRKISQTLQADDIRDHNYQGG